MQHERLRVLLYPVFCGIQEYQLNGSWKFVISVEIIWPELVLIEASL